ncbi:MAG: type II toxin-antitoxin system Phd/YefM family antitoxin [Desulfobacteraceae bacterium]|nr:type II toxin-antitoxin system Phd/YefM family antitoxin [Desulfobacteraceae bacterium]MBU4001772.1 type II toxin-antitoxin system prevent-host-death family antitoxin [Pseudomonadota bacterium]MBU4055713.1 type II toxin-antitoxin system prevent-host-death family antitoxin [Pseudomonadota bacterium]
MKQFNIAEAKSHFSKLIKLAMLGEEIVIARDNKPLLKLIPIHEVKKVRQPGSAKGQILYIAPDFDELLPDFKENV